MGEYSRHTDITLKELGRLVFEVLPTDAKRQPYNVRFNLHAGDSFVGEVDESVLNVRVPPGVDTQWYNNVESVEMA